MRIRWLAQAAALGFGVLLAGCGQQAAGWRPPQFPSGNPVVGASIFKTTCTACHGAEATGVPGLAPALRGHAYLFTLYPTEAQLAAFIHDYMPRNNPGSLTKSQAADLAAFIYGLNGKLGHSSETHLLALLGVSAPPPTAPPVKTPRKPTKRPPVAKPTPKPPKRPSTAPASAAEIAAGQRLYLHSCYVCHGKNGQGFANSYNAPGLWPPSATAGAVAALGPSGLATFIQQNMPLVTTNGVARGSLTGSQAQDLAAFILSHK